MIKEFAIWTTILLSGKFCCAQTFEHLMIKERYDLYNVLEVNQSNYEVVDFQDPIPQNRCDFSDPDIALKKSCTDPDACVYGDGLSKVLMGYLTMYETTRDKAYLYKFIYQSMCVLENRHDVQNALSSAQVNGGPKWTRYCDVQTHHDGLIIDALSRFGFLVKVKEPALYGEPLHDLYQDVPNEEDPMNPNQYMANTKFCNFTQHHFSTFGEYADTLDNRVEQSLQWFIDNGYWTNDNALYKGPAGTDIGDTIRVIQEINKQCPFGNAFMFNGITTGNADFVSKAGTIADKHTDFLNLHDCDGDTYDEYILRGGQGQGYWWHVNGWTVKEDNCILHSDREDIDDYTKYYEDISHATLVTDFVFNANLYLPNNLDPFDDAAMVAFRNMVTNRLYSNGTIILNVRGELPRDTKIHVCHPDPCDQQRKDALATNIINYIPYCVYDEHAFATGTKSVYEICMEYYEDNLDGQMPVYYSNQHNWGHAKLVAAQWAEECPNLTLYNRRVVYDQDFFSKNILTVAPEANQHTQLSYADPIISDPTFTVETGITSEMTAPEEIVLKTGFHAKAGCSFTARIDDQLCGGGQKNLAFDGGGVNQHGGASDLSEKETSKPRTNSELVLKLFPNPMKDEGTIHVRTPSEVEITLKLKDNYGRDVLLLTDKKRIRGVYNETLSTSSLKPGVYFLALTINNEQVKTEKLVVVR